MIEWSIFFSGLRAVGLFYLAGWLLSLARNNISHTYTMWPLAIGMTAYTYSLFFYALHDRNILILILITLWAMRAASYQTSRFWGRANKPPLVADSAENGALFWLSNIYSVFGLSALCAWLVSLPLFGSIQSNTPLTQLDYIGAAIVLFGICYQSIADWQLASFRANQDAQAAVLDTGLWQYSRHPNYFGECCVWWGFYCIAFAANAAWTVISPLIITTLLLRQSNIMLKHLNGYVAYAQSRNALFPSKPKT